MQRRRWLQGILAMAAWNALPSRASTPQLASMKAIEDLQKSWKALLAADFKAPSPAEPMKLSKDEWRKRLDKTQFNVLRQEGTEPPGTSPLNNEKRAGVFACAGCDLPLFTSDMKYDSGTGWPSFFTTIPGVFAHKEDTYLFIPRNEYHCIRCGGHHGHVFDDGPPPTRQRWCNNGVALKFIPRTGRA